MDVSQLTTYTWLNIHETYIHVFIRVSEKIYTTCYFNSSRKTFLNSNNPATDSHQCWFYHKCQVTHSPWQATFNTITTTLKCLNSLFCQLSCTPHSRVMHLMMSCNWEGNRRSLVMCHRLSVIPSHRFSGL